MGFGVRIPFVDHLGFELRLFDGGLSELGYAPKPEHLNSFAVTHGGALMTLLDVTMAVAARSVSPPTQGPAASGGRAACHCGGA